eukprot:TRINITY_DN340_c0_g1_i1.p1 TRINITY_DN340_c0_g1~~TRINITY_DN340_c0_g1_i1.p1  ORF type:complete len:188 (-),score=63.35 TRINITY_DN340_c0_g1_i1:144-707(-)
MVVIAIVLDNHDYSVAKFPIAYPDELKGELEENEFIQIIKIANEQFRQHIFIAPFWLSVLHVSCLEPCLKGMRGRLFKGKIDHAASAINSALQATHDKLMDRGVYLIATVSTHIYDEVDAAKGEAPGVYYDLKIEFRIGSDALEDIEISRERAPPVKHLEQLPLQLVQSSPPADEVAPRRDPAAEAA